MRRPNPLRLAYLVLSWMAVPLLAVHLFWRSLSVPGYRRRIPERFGLCLPPLPAQPSLWVHAVSVGEVQAAAPLIRALLREYPGIPLVVTTMTPTGSDRVRALFGNQVINTYVPYDLVGAVRRFLDWAQPRLAIIMETELWPHLYAECGQRGVPLVLASARISPRSVARYRRLLPLFRDTLSHGIVIAAQSAADAARFRELGAAPGRTHVTGNIKFDVELPGDLVSGGTALRHEQAAGRAVWIAASTHEGEEIAAIEAHRRIRRDHPEALLLLVPRHPERFASVAALLEREGLGFVTRSSGQRCAPATAVFLGDSMGELTLFYAAADVAFVGGSLVKVGGHNLLEPAALGVPALTGPYNFNAADIAGQLIEAGAVDVVADAGELAGRVSALLGDAAERTRRGDAARRVLGDNRGSLARLLSLVRPLLGPR